jgi:hypothetical protein
MTTDQQLPVSAGEKPPSRWTAFFDRWNSGAEHGEPVYDRFKAAFNAFSLMSADRVNPWLLAALSLALIAGATVAAYGVFWAISQHHHVFLLGYLSLKLAKWVLIGGAFLISLALRNWVMPKPATDGADEQAAR